MATINISNGLIHSTGAYCLSAGSSDSYVMIHDNYVCVPALCTGSTANFNNIVVSGDLTVHGSCTILNTTVCTTSAMSITNQGTGPALVVNQTGSQPVVSLLDDGNSVFYIEDGGNVGIGTTNPAYGLDIRNSTTSQTGALYVQATLNSSGKGLVINSNTRTTADNAEHLLQIIDRANSDSLVTTVEGITLARLSTRLNTSSPLQVNSQIALGGSLYTFSTVQGGADLTLTSNANPANIGVNSNIVFKLGTSGGGGPTERMRITSTGNVGIGTTSPSSILNINGGVGSLSKGLTFGDGDTGIWESADDTLRISTGSSTRMTVTSAGNVGIGTTDPAAKLDVCGTDTVFSVNGTNGTIFNVTDDLSDSLMSVNTIAGLPVFEVFADNTIIGGRYNQNDFYLQGSTGNIGIGTSSPITKLNIKGDQSANGQLYIEPKNDEEYAGLVIKTTRGADRAYAIFAGGTGTDDLNFRFRDASAGADRMVIDSSGNVGINTTSPDSGLTIAKNQTSAHTYTTSHLHLATPVTSNNGGATTISFATSTVDNYGWSLAAIRETTTGYDTRFAFKSHPGTDSGDERFSILADGNVGIGTTDPDSSLMVYKSAADSIIHVRGASNGADARVRINGYNSSELYIDRNGSGRFAFRRTTGTDDLSLLKLNNDYTDNSTIMFWDYSSGNVGIGTTDPVTPLHVSSNANNIARFSGTGTAGTYIKLDESGTQAWVIGLNNGTTTLHIREDDYNGTARLSIGTAELVVNEDSGNYNFRVEGDGDANLIKTDASNDRVGIGTASPAAKLDVCGTDTVFSVNGTNGTLFSVVDDLSDSLMSVNDAAGLPVLEVFADNTICAGRYSCSDFYLDGSSGNIGIGTTNPQAKLEVSDEALIDGLTVGRGGGSVSTNTAVGTSALENNTTGNNNTAHGYAALRDNTTGSYNTAHGYAALRDNTTGCYNTTHGYAALLNNTTGSRNTAVGYSSLCSNTTGFDNTAVGMYSLCRNTTGYSNTAHGYEALRDNATGYQNTAVGFKAIMQSVQGIKNTATGTCTLYSNTTGNQNVAYGVEALHKNTAGSYNTAVGYSSMFWNTTGSSNTAYGYMSLYCNTTGCYNTAVGLQPLYCNTTGSCNTASGYRALFCNTTGTNNTAVGTNSLCRNTIGAYNTAVGDGSLYLNTTGNSNVAVGRNSLFNNTTGRQNIAVGVSALSNNTTGCDNTATGTTSLNLNTAGSYNTAYGMYSLLNNTTGINNTANGYMSLRYNTTGTKNTAVGTSSLYCNTTGVQNTAVGYQALRCNTTGINNTAHGYEALRSNTTGSCVAAFGYLALRCNTTGAWSAAFGACAATVTTGNGTTAIGGRALEKNTTGFYNTATGNYALFCNTTASMNSAFGWSALWVNTTGNYNVAVGNSALGANTTGGNNTGLGNGALINSTTGNDNVGIGGSAGIGNTTGCRNIFIGASSGSSVTTAIQTIAVGRAANPSNTDYHTVWGSSANNVCNCVYTSWSNVSDCRDKTDIAPLNSCYGISFIKKLSPVSYKWDNRQTYVEKCNYNYGQKDGSLKSEKCHYGFLAQDIKTSLEELNITFDGLGHDEEKDAYRLTYEELIAPLVKAVQELTERVEILEKDNASLKDRIYELENK